jgi:hypothetical protein
VPFATRVRLRVRILTLCYREHVLSFSRVLRELKGQEEEAKVMAKPRHAQGSAR